MGHLVLDFPVGLLLIAWNEMVLDGICMCVGRCVCVNMQRCLWRMGNICIWDNLPSSIVSCVWEITCLFWWLFEGVWMNTTRVPRDIERKMCVCKITLIHRLAGNAEEQIIHRSNKGKTPHFSQFHFSLRRKYFHIQVELIFIIGKGNRGKIPAHLLGGP